MIYSLAALRLVTLGGAGKDSEGMWIWWAGLGTSCK